MWDGPDQHDMGVETGYCTNYADDQTVLLYSEQKLQIDHDSGKRLECCWKNNFHALLTFHFRLFNVQLFVHVNGLSSQKTNRLH